VHAQGINPSSIKVRALKDLLQVLPFYAIVSIYPSLVGGGRKCRQMHADKQDVLKRLNYIEGRHLSGIWKMIEEDKYCVDILRQTCAVRKAIETLKDCL